METSTLRASRLVALPSRLRGPGSEDEKERMSGQDGSPRRRGFPGRPVGRYLPLEARQWHEDRRVGTGAAGGKQAKIKDWTHFVNSEKVPPAGLFMKQIA